MKKNKLLEWLRIGLPIVCATVVLSSSPAAPRVRRYNVTRAGEAYGITVAVMTPEAFRSGRITVSIHDGQGEIAAKALNTEDLDFYVTARPRQTGELSVRLDAPSALLDAAKVKVDFSPLSLAGSTTVAMQPNGDRKSAQTIEPGRTVYGAEDGGSSRFQWFRFMAHDGSRVGFSLETPDGEMPEEVRVFDNLEAGICYIRVTANYSTYQLRSASADVPKEIRPRVSAKARTEHLDELLEDLQSAPAAQARRVLNESSWVLARAAAAEALARMKDRDAIPALERALGDPSKLVQRAAARGLREMEAAPALTAALRSGNGRVRWGALQALQQESGVLAGHTELLAEVKAALHDAVPQNRAYAVNALSRWTP